MSALAIAFKKHGYQVTGSDKGFYPPVSTQLEKAGVKFYPGWHPDRVLGNLNDGLVVVGNVAGSENAEWQYVQEKNLSYCSYPELIEKYMVKKNSIVCAGTYGKTTTAALMSWILTKAQWNPSYMFGGISQFPSARLADADWSILEGDEYKTSQWDPTPKFSHYRPTHLLLTSLVWDHADVFKKEKDYVDAFQKLVDVIPNHGLIVVSEKVENLSLPCALRVIRYGMKKNEYQYHDVKTTKHGINFFIAAQEETIEMQASMLGDYSADNITGCFALGREIGIASDIIREAVKEFPGVKRRLEKRLDGAVDVYDDIAHSPQKAYGVLTSVRKLYPKKLIAIFEPNIGNRCRALSSDYDSAFAAADEIIIPRLSSIKKGNRDEEPMDGEEIADTIARTHLSVQYIENDNDLVSHILSSVSPGDVVVFLGSHGFRGMIESLCTNL